MKNDNRLLMVTICCFTYNQESYIRECLEGFVMQKTDFRFEAIVHDDASTDGTAAIIREYEAKYPDIIKPIYETENQYSKHDGSLDSIMNEHMHGKYIAVCEGDDYWIDSLKLQKQFDFMEAHPECSICFHANFDLYSSGERKIRKPKKIKEFNTPEDTILGGGGFMATNSMFYRGEYLRNEVRPYFWECSPVGDLPLKLYFATKGVVGYIDEVMSVYRRQAIGSWSTRKKNLKIKTKHHCAILKMYEEYDKYTNGMYHQAILKMKYAIVKRIIKDFIKCFINKSLLRKKLE